MTSNKPKVCSALRRGAFVGGSQALALEPSRLTVELGFQSRLNLADALVCLGSDRLNWRRPDEGTPKGTLGRCANRLARVGTKLNLFESRSDWALNSLAQSRSFPPALYSAFAHDRLIHVVRWVFPLIRPRVAPRHA